VLTIRPASLDDRRGIELLLRELQAFEVSLRPSRQVPSQVSPRYLKEILSRRSKRHGDVLVAERGGSLIGFISYDLVTEHLEREQSEMSVTDLIVTAAQRGRGVGRALLKAVEARAAAKGIMRITLATVIGNKQALAAYRRWGFRPAYLVLEKRVRRRHSHK
jgi:GNAT superfamily N-acetyltransferase